MSRCETSYQAFGSGEEEEEEEENDDVDLTMNEDQAFLVAADGGSGNWNHIENLDDFFTRVYEYHQRGGYICMALEDLFNLVQFIFVAIFAYFLSHCVNYTVLFHEVQYNTTHKVTLDEAIYPMNQCIQGLRSSMVVFLMVMFLGVVLYRLIRVGVNIIRCLHIKNFFDNALNIYNADLSNLTWHEVQGRLLEVQKEHQMCVHKRELTQLDIYHRILRFKNYMVAMANVNTIPLKFHLPCVGEYAYLSLAYKTNLEYILFLGPGAPFENSWHLREEYKNARNKASLTRELDKRILWFGMANLVFSPLIFFWNALYFFFRYVEMFKRQPGFFGMRRWSNFSRLFLRHFNELDHELNARLSKGYQPVGDYLKIFVSAIAVIIAKFVMFLAGAVTAVLLVLTLYDEDVLAVQHVLLIMALAGGIVHICHGVIPDEHTVHSPELLLRNVAMAIHYMPDNWAGHAHTERVRNAFYILFPYELVYILEELLSPLVTPFILLFWVRPRAPKMVDFLRQFTVDVVGVGDVCSFAQMDVKRHGNVKWQFAASQPTAPPPPRAQQAENGKTEMSLMHFHLMNPEWRPDTEGSIFINNLRGQVQREVQGRSMLMAGDQQSLISPSLALPSLAPLPAFGALPALHQPHTFTAATSTVGHTASPAVAYSSMMSSLGTLQAPGSTGTAPFPRLRGAVSQLAGPANRVGATSLFSSLHSSLDELPPGDSCISASASASAHASLYHQRPQAGVDNYTRELMSIDMNVAALCLQEVHRQRRNGNYASPDDYLRAVWQPTDTHSTDAQAASQGSYSAQAASQGSYSAQAASLGSHTASTPTGQGHELMPEIAEDEEREVDTSDLPPAIHRTSPPL